MSEPDIFATTYGVELLFQSKPVLNRKLVWESVRHYCPEVLLAGEEDESATSVHLIHPDFPVEYADGSVPAQTLIASTDTTFLPEKYESAFQQSWSFPEVRKVVATTKFSVLVTDLMASALEPKDRIHLFLKALMGITEALPCTVIYWPLTEQFVEVQSLRSAFARSVSSACSSGPLNVRFFNISNSPGDMVMDTLGLGALGQTDLQCHFRGMDPQAVARILLNTAVYLLENGDVIENGQTVQGRSPMEKWKCQYEDSLLKPSRVVLDLNPGGQYAAGGR